jgi:hypothetical protein
MAGQHAAVPCADYRARTNAACMCATAPISCPAASLVNLPGGLSLCSAFRAGSRCSLHRCPSPYALHKPTPNAGQQSGRQRVGERGCAACRPGRPHSGWQL